MTTASTLPKRLPPLLNFGKLPTDRLSGVTSDELDLITRLSANGEECNELISGFVAFLESPEESNARDSAGMGEELDELDKVEIDAMPESSKRQMADNGARFVDFLRTKGLRTDIESLDDASLNQYLRLFYFQLKSKDGNPYSPSSLACVRAGIQRFLNVVCKRPTNLMAKHSAFDGSNRMLCFKIRQFIEPGQQTRQFDPIEEGDLCKLREYFDRRDAERLQDEVVFHLFYELGERGQEHLRHLMDRGCLQRGVDADGRSYLALPSLPSKNRVADIAKPSHSSDGKHARIYDTELIDNYLALIPASSASFLPKPLEDKGVEQYRFAEKATRGFRWLQEFMKNLSDRVALSKSSPVTQIY